MPSPRLLLSLAILLVGGLALWLYAASRERPPGPGVVLVDTRPALDEILRTRAAQEPGSLPSSDVLGRLPIDEALALRFHPALEDSFRNVYDPKAYYVPRPGFRAQRTFLEHPAQGWEIVTDSRGFRRPGEIARQRPDLRILVVGDSHVEGVMPVEETMTMRLERLLQGRHRGDVIEVLNGSRGGYAFYNYLGALERNLDLQPHVFVMVVFGGNDFAGFLPMHLYFRGLELPGAGSGWERAVQLAQRVYGQGVAQEYHQLAYFARAPEALELALSGAVDVVLEAARICDLHDIRFVCAYLPPVGDIERERVQEGLEKLEEIFGLEREHRGGTDRLADRFLALLGEKGIETLDLRPALRENEGPHYWLNDHHLSPRGHEVVSRQLYERLIGHP